MTANQQPITPVGVPVDPGTRQDTVHLAYPFAVIAQRAPGAPVAGSSPLLADNRLITLSTKGVALALNPKTGATVASLKLGSEALLGPIAVGGMIYVVTESGQLVAIR